LKEQFAPSPTNSGPARAERFLRAWVYEAEASGLPQLVKFAKTLRHWWDEFLNYFNEGSRVASSKG